MADPVWVGSITIRAGAFHVGVRTDHRPLLDQVRSAFGDRLVDDDRATTDYGLVVSARPGGGRRLRPYLSHGRCVLLRTRSHARLLRRLDLELGQLVDEPTDRSVAIHGMTALVSSGRAVLIPARTGERSTGVERVLAKQAIGLAEPVGLRLDPIAGEVIVPTGLTDDLNEMTADGLAVRPGRYPVVGVFWLSEQHDRYERPAIALVRLLGQTGERRGMSLQEVLDGLAAMRDSFSIHPLGHTGTADLAKVVEHLRAGVPGGPG